MDSDVLIVGSGISGVVAALELLDAGQRVTLIERGSPQDFGGLAPWSFGGLFFADSPVQRRAGIKDSVDLAWQDWQSTARFSEHDHLPRAWAQRYIEHSTPRVHDWLTAQGLKIFPFVNWIERGLYTPGNSVPRFHLVWGTGYELFRVLATRLREHPQASRRLHILFEHQVDDLLVEAGAVVGVQGMRRVPAGSTATALADWHGKAPTQPFSLHAPVTIIATGGLGGSIEKVRAHWPAHWGSPPEKILNGASPLIDGRGLEAAQRAGARLTHLDRHWPYAGGIHHPRPRHPDHGLSIVPPRSALWMNHRGRRMGPIPVPASSFDTQYAVERICQEARKYSWQVMNRKIMLKEFAISGSESNTALRDRKLPAFLATLLRGNQALMDDMLAHCPDFVVADTLEELAAKMNGLQGDEEVDAAGMIADIRAYDAMIRRGPKYHNDDQLRRIAQLRQYLGDRLRTCKFQAIEDPAARPYIAVRLHICSRKTLGGIQTDLHSRVSLAHSRVPSAPTRPEVIPGLYAVGEAAGYGGGGMNGQAVLEGTFLGGCIYSARVAAHHISGRAW